MPLEYLVNSLIISIHPATTDPQKMANYDVESTTTPESKVKLEGDENAILGMPEEGTIIDSYVAPQSLKGFLKSLATAGVELRGLEPVPLQERTHTKYYNIFTLFGGSFISLLP